MEKGNIMTYYNIPTTAERIRKLRLEQGLTQQTAADQLEISFGFLSRLERGLQGCSLELLARLSVLYDVSMDYLVLGASRTGLSREGVERLIAFLQELLEEGKVY